MKLKLAVAGALAVLGLTGGFVSLNSPQDKTSSPTVEAEPTPGATSGSSFADLLAERQKSEREPSTKQDFIDYNCDQFDTQQEAQAYFDSQGGSKTNNVDDLDRDADGYACDLNP